MNGYIYKFTNRINGKKYVGQTNNIETRYKAHLSSKRNDPFHSALRKYGVENFDFEVIEHINSIEDSLQDMKKKLDELEIEYIKKENSKHPLGYNLTDGGYGSRGYKLSQEHKDKISAANTGKKWTDEQRKKLTGRKHSEDELVKMSKNRKGIPAWNKGLKTKKESIEKAVKSREWFYKSGGPNKGKKMSDEQKQKLSESHTGKKHSEETKEKLREYNKTHPEKYEKMKGRKMPDEQKQKISKSLKGVANTKGKIWINNGVKSTLINENELDKYLFDGWVKGRKLNNKK